MTDMKTNRQSGGHRLSIRKVARTELLDLATIQVSEIRTGLLALDDTARRLRGGWKFRCGRVVDDLAKLRSDAAFMTQQLADLAESLASDRKDAQEAASLRELFTLMGADERSLTPGAIHRAIGRLRLLRRYQELRAVDGGSKMYLLLGRVAREAASTAPGIQCSPTSLARWVSRCNAQRDGLAVGVVAAILDRRGRLRKRCPRPGGSDPESSAPLAPDASDAA
jgi:hypothetical protein